MKNITLTGLAALCLAALAQQRAAAQCCPPPCCRQGGEISFNIGLSFGIRCSHPCGHWVPDCPPPCYGYPPQGYGYPPPAAAATASANQFRAPQPTPIAAPNPPPPVDAPKSGPGGVQGVAYTYPAGYGYNAAALYESKYGSPYYQASSYRYGN